MPQISKTASVLALAAALSMAATPVAAAELPTATARVSIPVDLAWEPGDDNAEHHRRYRYRRNRVDAGDVLAGVLIIGGIAAIASAATKNRRDRDYRYRDRNYRDRDYRYQERRGDSRHDNSSGLNNAVNICVRTIERDVRVDRVDAVDRTGDGWRVTGALYNGEGFTCRIGGDGRISSVDYGGRSEAGYEDRQWDDKTYRAAWNDVDTGATVQQAPVPSGPQPAYPGGPIDGDLSD